MNMAWGEELPSASKLFPTRRRITRLASTSMERNIRILLTYMPRRAGGKCHLSKMEIEPP